MVSPFKGKRKDSFFIFNCEYSNKSRIFCNKIAEINFFVYFCTAKLKKSLFCRTCSSVG